MSELLSGLNPEQTSAVIHKDGPLLIVAGAGTGKTSVITKKMAYFIEQGYAKPDQILALTFTEKAANEMQERVDVLVPYGYADVWISTFHAFCERILRQYAMDIGLSTDFRLLTDTESWMLVRKNLDKFPLDYYKPRSRPTKFIYALLNHFSRCKDECITPDRYLDFAQDLSLDHEFLGYVEGKEGKTQEIKRILEVAQAYKVYQDLLLEQNVFDFGDLVTNTVRLLEERPAIREMLSKKFLYTLVDEFQDTNIAQYRLIKLLVAPNNNVTVCADDDQAIYKFRGASVSNVLQFKQDFPNTKMVLLTQNYRSTQQVLDVAHHFIQNNNPDRLEFQEKIDKRLKSNLNVPGEVTYLHTQTMQQEILAVIEKIKQAKMQDPTLQWSDFAILARSNASASVFCGPLGNAGIPFVFLSLKGLFQKSVILDLVSYLKLLDNYHESPALYRVLHMPVFALHPSDFTKMTFAAYKAGSSLYEVMQQSAAVLGISPKGYEIVKKVVSLVNRHTSLAKEKTVAELIPLILQETGYLAYLSQDPKDNTQPSLQLAKENVESLQYLSQFYDYVKNAESSGGKLMLYQFMDELSLQRESGDEGSIALSADADLEGVRVMTVHASKGLEFTYVFLVHMVDKRFPTIERKDPISLPTPLIGEILPTGDAHLQEERRLMYVALTRAKRFFYATFAQDYGGLRKKKPSPFLSEAGLLEQEAQLVEVDDVFEQAPKPVTPTIKYRLPAKFSFTQLAAFNKCPLQYKFAHILRIPTFGKAVFSYGKSMHTVLQKFVQMVMEKQKAQQGSLFTTPEKTEEFPSWNTLMKLYDQYWISDWYANKTEQEEYKKKGKESLKAFYDQFITHKPSPIMVEQRFFVKVGPHTLTGSIDRVDTLSDNTVEIIDYKTGKSKAGKELELEDKMQLLIYQLAATQVLGLPVGKLTFYYLDDGSSVSFLGTKEELSEMEEGVKAQVKMIQASDFPANPGFMCQYCDFNEICEHADLG